MGRATPIVTNFTGGELSPYLDGRTDLSCYYNSARTCENFICLPQGAAERRGGTRFINEAKFAAKRFRLIPFEFSDEQAYVIEAGDLYFRFYMNKGRIEAAPNTPYELASPYAEADLAGLKWCQSADVMYLVHPRHAPRKLSRSGHANWTIEVVDFIDGPYLDENTTGTTLTPSATSGSVTLTASAKTGINSGAGFVAGDVGRRVRLKNGSPSKWGWLEITAITSPTVVQATVRGNDNATDDSDALASTAATKAWRLGLWSNNTGWPSAVTFHEERLTFASATRLRPQRIDGSKIGDFETFSPGVEDSDAIGFSIGSNKVNKIRWLASMRVLLSGTMGAEFAISADSANSPLTPTNAQAKPNTRYGCADILPVEAGQAVLFLQRAGRKLRELKYAFENDGYVASNLTLRAEHVTRTGVIELAYQQEPYSLVWGCRADGQLIACTYLPEQQVTGWHRHPLADDGKGETLAVIPGGSGSDQLWLGTRRTIGGVVKRYIEILEDPLPLDGSQSDAFYVDCGLSYSGAATTTIGGLGHLEGKTVQVLAGGGVHPVQVVTNGRIALDWPAATVHVGLGYVSKLKPMKIEAGAGEGTAQGKIKIITKVILRLARSLGGKMGRDEANLEPILDNRDPAVPMDQPMPLFTGDAEVDFPGNYEDTGDLLVVQDQPLPFTVNAIIPRVVTADG